MKSHVAKEKTGAYHKNTLISFVLEECMMFRFVSVLLSINIECDKLTLTLKCAVTLPKDVNRSF